MRLFFGKKVSRTEAAVACAGKLPASGTPSGRALHGRCKYLPGAFYSRRLSGATTSARRGSGVCWEVACKRHARWSCPTWPLQICARCVLFEPIVGRDDLGAPRQWRVLGSCLQAARPVVVPYRAAANMRPVRFIQADCRARRPRRAGAVACAERSPASGTPGGRALHGRCKYVPGSFYPSRL